MARKVKAKLATEERASGGGVVLQSEPDKLVEELITLRHESEKESEEQSEAKTKAVFTAGNCDRVCDWRFLR